MIRKQIRHLGDYAGDSLYVVEIIESSAENSIWGGIYCYGLLQPMAIVISGGEGSVVVDCEGKLVEADELLVEIDQLKVALLASESGN